LPDEVLIDSRAILSQHGNMSSATVLFILNRMATLHRRRPIVAIGLGPGLMAEGMLLD
jgi:alpha-pyrone synthase